jgi:hypothetical protein
MHIGACAVFEGPAPAFEDFVAMTTSKLPQVPRFRQIVRGVRFRRPTSPPVPAAARRVAADDGRWSMCC